MQENVTIPMTDEDREMLLHIYEKRLGLFIKTFIFLFITGFVVIVKIGKGYSEMPYKSVIAMNSVLLTCFISISAIVVYRTRIWRVKKDATNGIKETVHYIITQKQQFENTGQYFIGLNHPDYLFHEIDCNTWSSLNIGDSFALYRAPLSKYIFNPQGKFSLM